ncbi:Spore coat associated protein JA (CotJA) [Clostridium sp. USBA 49]|jgi:hypothetical protein|uniref:spore coat associated protein CotJA n=1 Tax=Clostridium sp. USBA 49 TaxID=1881060 RepID=UPI00099A91CD|nr:spore coat associated protein CotJA [Clostridium sp. USBA 49]SKA80937.1 Spore coat associated protein JA (CotJA) [Clostridium sp. USBA 49]
MAYILKPEDGIYNEPCIPMQECIPQEMVIKNVRLATAYVPYQNLCELFKPLEALKRGTAFPELYSKFEAPYDPQAVYKSKVKKNREYYNEPDFD